MKLVYRTIWGLLVVCTLTIAKGARADLIQYSQDLPFDGNVVNAWMLVLNGSDVEFIKPDIIKSTNSIKLNTNTLKIEASTLVNAVAVYDTGQIESTSLHRPNQNEMVVESIKVAEQKANDLENRIEVLKNSVAQLTTKVDEANKSIRKEAGLEEVDRILEKVATLDAKIKAQSDLLGELNKLLSK